MYDKIFNYMTNKINDINIFITIIVISLYFDIININLHFISKLTYIEFVNNNSQLIHSIIISSININYVLFILFIFSELLYWLYSKINNDITYRTSLIEYNKFLNYCIVITNFIFLSVAILYILYKLNILNFNILIIILSNSNIPILLINIIPFSIFFSVILAKMFEQTIRYKQF